MQDSKIVFFQNEKDLNEQIVYLQTFDFDTSQLNIKGPYTPLIAPYNDIEKVYETFSKEQLQTLIITDLKISECLNEYGHFKNILLFFDKQKQFVEVNTEDIDYSLTHIPDDISYLICTLLEPKEILNKNLYNIIQIAQTKYKKAKQI